MKTKTVLCMMAALAIFSMFSCKKDHDENDGLSDNIKNFVPQYLIDSMRSWGLKINEGATPPVINGIYLQSPNKCVFDKSNNNRTGQYFLDYKVWFYNQNQSDLSIQLNRKTTDNRTDTASGIGAYLSGSNNSFTAFLQTKGVLYGIPYTYIEFYSGEKTSGGISNFQYAFYMIDKGADPGNKLVSIGSSRIFEDEDGLAATTDTYRLAQSPVSGNANGKIAIGAY